MTQEYVQARDGNLYVGSSRVAVETIITSWRSLRQTPEQIKADFPTISLAAIYGTISNYLDHQDELDAFFHETEEHDRLRQAAEEARNPEFYAQRRRHLAEARMRLGLNDSDTSG